MKKLAKKELAKFKDRYWRLNHLYKITNKQGELVTFKQNNIQTAIYGHVSNRKMILKARQFGVSTGAIIDLFDECIFTPNRNHMILAHEDDAIRKLFRIVKTAYREMDRRIRPPLDRGGGSMYEMYFPTINSRIYCDLESRGDTIHRLHISEAAFADKNRMIATMQAVPIHTGKVTIETTAKGMGNHFYEWWVDPARPEAKLFFPWYMFPEYSLDSTHMTPLTDDEREFCLKAKKLFDVNITKGQIAYRRFKQAELKDLFIQEYPEDDKTCFLASGNAAMDLARITELIAKARTPIEQTSSMKIFERYDKTKHYAIGADTAEGVRQDYSVGKVFETKTFTEVASIRSNRWKPAEFAHELDKLAKRYTGGGRSLPLLGVERNNHGHTTLHVLDEELNYPNLYRTKDEKIGWLTNGVTRPKMIDAFIEAVEDGTATIHDTDTLGECLTLIDNKGKIEAEEGYNDDTIVASAIALQMCMESGSADLYNDIQHYMRV